MGGEQKGVPAALRNNQRFLSGPTGPSDLMYFLSRISCVCVVCVRVVFHYCGVCV